MGRELVDWKYRIKFCLIVGIWWISEEFKRLKKDSASCNNSKSTSAVISGDHYHKSLPNFMAQIVTKSWH